MLTCKYSLVGTGMGNGWSVGKLERTSVKGHRPIGIPVRRTNPFHREVGLEDRIKRGIKSEGARVHPNVNGKRVLPKTEVIVRRVRQGVQTIQVREKVRRQVAARKCTHTRPFTALGCEIPGVCSVQHRSANLAKRVAADKIVAKLDPQGLRIAGALSSDA